LRAHRLRSYTPYRALSTSPPLHNNAGTQPKEKEPGALSARLEQLSEEALESGGTGARKAIEEAGFDPELKRRLEERIAGANFRSKHAGAIAQADLPSSAGTATKHIAGAAPWTGTESVEDASLRMLQDAHKPLRGGDASAPRGPPVRIDTGRAARGGASSGVRIANARDRTSIYTTIRDSGMSKEEREQYRKEMKARFTPTGRTGPATIQGLASLANERIEDAIARGQFKNIPRGKGKHTERDYAANSPFLDTTEYLMNKIIQRQEIVPPWIEKQQELLSTASKFRARLRNDWKRHASRMIASKGGSLESQVERARAYAAAEAIVNPPKKKVEVLDTVDSKGQVSQITLTGHLKVPAGGAEAGAAPETEIRIEETVSPADASSQPAASPLANSPPAAPEPQSLPATTAAAHTFRDPVWEANEHSFHALTVNNLNSICRSYNLIAPQMAQKPYYSLERELKSCFADVAPLLADEILERATRPKVKVEVIGHASGGFLESTFQRESTRVYDENLRVKGYGFRQFWRDFWGTGEKRRTNM